LAQMRDSACRLPPSIPPVATIIQSAPVTPPDPDLRVISRPDSRVPGLIPDGSLEACAIPLANSPGACGNQPHRSLRSESDFMGHEIFIGLAATHECVRRAVDEDFRRAGARIVVAAHRHPVGAGTERRHEIAAL